MDLVDLKAFLGGIILGKFTFAIVRTHNTI